MPDGTGCGIVIHAEGLAYSYRARRIGGTPVPAVHEVSLDVARAEVVAFLGPNGAGKSTTFRMLTGAVRPSAGRVRVAGHELPRQARAVRRRIGCVGQSSGTSPDSTVVEELVTQGRLYGLGRGASRRRAAELLADFELTGVERRQTKTLSAGQRRRLDVALALVHGPDVLFLDEPTAGIDPHARAHLWAHIELLRREHGTTVLLSTHYLDEADGVADRVYVIDRGRVVAEGSPADLKATTARDPQVRLHVPSTSLQAAMAHVLATPDTSDAERSDEDVTFRYRRESSALPDVISALVHQQIPILSLHVEQPSLDDFFLGR
jgi:ABC-2 type transport system ATP-binding protein